jgi:hypothetical protein
MSWLFRALGFSLRRGRDAYDIWSLWRDWALLVAFLGGMSTTIAALVSQAPAWQVLLGGFGAYALIAVAINQTLDVISRFRRRERSEPVEVRPKPTANDLDYAKWAKIERLELWQVACLWEGIEPDLRLVGGLVHARLQTLRQDIFERQLDAEIGEVTTARMKMARAMVSSMGPRIPDDIVMERTLVRRVALRRYADKIREDPAFISGDFRPQPGIKATEVRPATIATDTESILKMTVGESGPYFTTDGSLYSIKRTFNLKLENIDRSTPVSDCSVNISAVTPPTDYTGPWPLSQGLSLAAGDHIFIPLVTYGEARDPNKYSCGDTFMTMGTEKGRPNLDAGTKYTITLRAVAPETAYCEFKCLMWVNDEGRLRIEELN